jgi:hypothetical protein
LVHESLIPGDPKVEQLGRPVLLQNYIRRFYVAMDDAVTVSVRERQANLLNDA